MRRLRSRHSACASFARPKSSTFTVPSGGILMFAGFRSRWMIPCSCAASSASAICLAIGSASSSGIGPRAIRCGEVFALDEFHHEGVDASWRSSRPVNGADVRMIQRREDLRFALNRASRSASVANESGRTLMATSRFSFVSRARYTSPMPPAPRAERFRTGRGGCRG